jgi:hypothetical protein
MPLALTLAAIDLKVIPLPDVKVKSYQIYQLYFRQYFTSDLFSDHKKVSYKEKSTYLLIDFQSVTQTIKRNLLYKRKTKSIFRTI